MSATIEPVNASLIEAVRRRLLKPEEIASRWGVSRSLVYQMIYRGDLPAVNLPGRVVRVDLDVIQGFERQAKPVHCQVDDGREPGSPW